MTKSPTNQWLLAKWVTNFHIKHSVIKDPLFKNPDKNSFSIIVINTMCCVSIIYIYIQAFPSLSLLHFYLNIKSITFAEISCTLFFSFLKKKNGHCEFIWGVWKTIKQFKYQLHVILSALFGISVSVTTIGGPHSQLECSVLTKLSWRLSVSIWMKQFRRGFWFSFRGECLGGALHHPLQPLSQVNESRKYTQDFLT